MTIGFVDAFLQVTKFVEPYNITAICFSSIFFRNKNERS